MADGKAVDASQAGKDDLQAKITALEAATQKRITELETQFREKINILEMAIGREEIFLNTEAYKLKTGDQVAPVIAKMTEFTKRRDKEFGWFSDPFFSHDKGYQIQVNVTNSGDHKHLSVFLNLKQGPHDQELPWPMTGRYEVRLLNQLNDSEHHCVVEDIKAARISTSWETWAVWTCYEFISLHDLQKITDSCQYLKDDSVFFQVIKIE